MHFLRLSILIPFILSGVQAPAAVKESDALALEMGVAFYNSMKSANKMFAALKINASVKDQEFIDTLNDKMKELQLPKASVKDGAIIIDGMSKPVKLKNIEKSIYTYDGNELDLSGKEGFEKSVKAIQRVIMPETTGWLDIFLPRAYAKFDTKDPLFLPSILLTLGGGAGAFMTCTGDKPNTGACALTSGMTGVGIGLFIAMLLKKDEPDRFACAGPYGPLTAYSGSTPLYTVGGNPYQISPSLAQVPGAGGLAAGAGQFCGQPQQLAMANQYYQTPSYIPLGQAPQRPPGMIAPYTGVRPLSTKGGVKPASKFKPAVKGGASR